MFSPDKPVSCSSDEPTPCIDLGVEVSCTDAD